METVYEVLWVIGARAIECDVVTGHPQEFYVRERAVRKGIERSESARGMSRFEVDPRPAVFRGFDTHGAAYVVARGFGRRGIDVCFCGEAAKQLRGRVVGMELRCVALLAGQRVVVDALPAVRFKCGLRK